MDKLLEFKNISRTFAGSQYQLQVSGVLEAGKILSVRGPSGAGKSTLLKILARLLPPDSGEICYMGQAYQQIQPQDWRREIQYLPQKPVVFAGTVEENLRLPFSLSSIQSVLGYQHEQVLHYMERLGLGQELLKHEAAKLSGGESARLALIRSLLLQPHVLLLDEPTAFLDERNAEQVLRVLQMWLAENSRRGMVIVSHKQEELQQLAELNYIDL